MMEDLSTVTPLVGFLVVEKTARGEGFIGAIMATDGRGYPLEFRATTPVRPSLVQRTLYGAQLEHYVAVELCGKTLVRESSRKPKTILVPGRLLLDIAEGAGVDVVAVWRAGESMTVEGDEGSPLARGTIRPGGSSFQPLVYEGRFTEPSREGEAIAHLQACASRFDLIEAFQRMRAALEILSQEDARYA